MKFKVWDICIRVLLKQMKLFELFVFYTYTICKESSSPATFQKGGALRIQDDCESASATILMKQRNQLLIIYL